MNNKVYATRCGNASNTLYGFRSIGKRQKRDSNRGEFSGTIRNFVGQDFWAREYYVSTVGKDEERSEVG